jgi:hypothetical protein
MTGCAEQGGNGRREDNGATPSGGRQQAAAGAVVRRERAPGSWGRLVRYRTVGHQAVERAVAARLARRGPKGDS